MAEAKFLIEPAQPADRAAVLDLLGHCGLPTDGLADHWAAVLVARDGEQVAGCAGLELYGQYALLRSVAVAPAYRGCGLGRQLTGQALQMARGRGVRQVYLLTETAADYFPRFGFQPVDRTAVPEAVRQSVEFTSACPQSAQAMALVLV
ncbi:MAG: GNAT family N-acetyltransferase [Chloroflexi bacterium]|nr:MAG: GNAT family N-acetyltransferase [Chloroflexota bacterium]